MSMEFFKNIFHKDEEKNTKMENEGKQENPSIQATDEEMDEMEEIFNKSNTPG